MALQEQAIFTKDSEFSYHMEWTLADISSARLRQHVRDLISTLTLHDSVNQNSVNVLLAFGERAWNSLSDHLTPQGLQSFRSIGMSSSRFSPSTQRDVMIWLHGPRHDENFRVALAINSILKGDAELRLELTGFRYFDGRDLFGFVEGAANPLLADAAHNVALIPEPLTGAGGSFVMTQKWQFDLDAFNKLDVGEQELVMGRRKLDGAELERAILPSNSHLVRAERDLESQPVSIYRRSSSYGSADENGLYFLAFSSELPRFNAFLNRMYGQERSAGVSDRLLDFMKPLTGSYWFAPALAHLQQVID